ncbi:MAG: glycosyltransferase family 2 protein [Carboxylicivirga sp.]|jgi:glycosyltransferase involved in cell wall biosynthesis|nr:glycosyltransferase family 2 protein [Carboxylicivirga sp.]
MNNQKPNSIPLVSVAMVTYNSAQHLRVAIESVLSSTYSNIELIISDDCSTDDTWEIIKSYDDPRIRAYQNKTNLREYPNRNQCINLAKGDYLIFIDGDDYLYPEGLEYLIDNLSKYPDETISMVIGRSWDENIIYPCLVSNNAFVLSNYIGKKTLLGLNFTRILFNTNILKNSDRFNSRYRIGDFYIQYLLGSNGDILLVKEGFAWWRRNPGQASERILLNGEASAEEFHIQYSFLHNKNCPLSADNREKAKQCIKRDFGRLLLRKLVKFRFGSFFSLMRISGYSARFLLNAFGNNKKNYNYSNLNE